MTKLKRNPWLAGLGVFSIILFLNSCKSTKFNIESEGLKYINLGDELPQAGTKRFHGTPMRDSSFSDKGYTWRVAVLNYNKGKIFVEEEFYNSGNVARIRIETPEFKLRNGVAVGDSVGRLQEIGGEWYCSPMPDVKLFDVYNNFFPRIHFVVAAPGRNFKEKDYLKHPFSEFDSKEKIVAIVIY